RGAEVDGKGFGRLGEAVAFDHDRERPADLAGRDGYVPGRGRVVAAGRGGDVCRGVVDLHSDGGGVRGGQREGGGDRAGVAFHDRHVADGDRRWHERPGLVVDEDRGAVPVVIGRGDVEPAIAVPVGGGQRIRALAGDEGFGGREGAITEA